MNLKNIIRWTSASLSVVFCASLLSVVLSSALDISTVPVHQPDVQALAQSDTGSADKDFRGLWVATVYNLDYPSVQTADAEKLKSDAVQILDFAKDNGYNAIVFQARPCSDAFFKSEYFPWSRFLTGEQGKAPNNNFDPLEFFIEQAHMRGLELHAWLNPYRVTKKDSADGQADVSYLAATHPARLHPEWTVKYSDGNIYFNPGIPEVRKLITDSITELVTNYDVDGIHFDDYFYPGSDFSDAQTYQTYGSSYSTIGDFRRASVDALIDSVGKAVKATDSDCRFGISPFGIWANKSSTSLGSDTRGTESYFDHYADTRKWVKNNMIDYIAPQLYWNIGNSVSCYQKLLNWWCDTAEGTDVDLYIGQAAYRAQNTDSSSVWYGTAEIERQLNLNKQSGAVSGSIFFRYKYLKNNSPLTSAISEFYKKLDAENVVSSSPQPTTAAPSNSSNSSGSGGSDSSSQNSSQNTGKPETSESQVQSQNFFISIFEKIIKSTADAVKSLFGNSTPDTNISSNPETSDNDVSDWAVLTVARPSSDISTSYSSFYFTGQSDPKLPLYINGEQITERSESGFYGKLVSLNSGNNSVKISQGNSSITRSIYRGSSASSPKKMDKAEIIQSSVFPQSAEYRQTGETVTLKCTAPSGCTVTAELYGKTYSLSPSSSASASLTQCVYSCSYKIPAVSGKAQNIELGNVKYTAVYKGKTYSALSPSKISVILKNSPFYVTVTDDIIDTYKTQSTSGGRHTYMTKDMRAYITGMSGSMIRLGQNCWVKKDGVTVQTLSQTLYPVISDAVYSTGEKYDTISFKSSDKTSAIAETDGKTLTLNVSPALKVCDVSLPSGGLFSDAKITSGSGFEKYSFTLKDSSLLDGYYVENTSDGFILYLKRRPKVSASSLSPLKGITVMLDPGHGGSDNGSIGCLGLNMPEKNVNINAALKISEKLKALGATVVMTRTGDTYVSLPDRQNASFKAKPDIFLSIHANSMDDNVDISKIRGISMFYKHSTAYAFAQKIFSGICADLSLANKGIHSSNLYVARATWTPSAICEIGFMPNPYDMELMASDEFLNSFAVSAAKNIVSYFS